ncbi:hypothetical protein ACRAKI_20090 [Saccharothrix isguenensis]
MTGSSCQAVTRSNRSASAYTPSVIVTALGMPFRPTVALTAPPAADAVVEIRSTSCRIDS